ncbi:hypothetical protein L2Y96_12335 [Luteibacter aegosomaticola]|uniref:hypothetical protein n=1 Tax=Luteibacter aegosomaticola TaxID=2911538 RepID=UPI001FF97387|nr:hypothetical protein [Luteibacter aegosomaticola]UPG88207.1 hypothetical protein L2Y96_12335 [Luteibacter aegosomaticola]
MGVPWHWLDEAHDTVEDAARHLLVEQALRAEFPERLTAHPEVVAALPALLDA